MIDVNLSGTFIMSRAVAPHGHAWLGLDRQYHVAQRRCARVPTPGAYPASKAAVALLTQHFALVARPARHARQCRDTGFIDAGMGAAIYEDPEVRAVADGASRWARSGRPKTSPKRSPSSCPTRPLHHRTSADGGRGRIVQPQESPAAQAPPVAAMPRTRSLPIDCAALPAVRDCAQAIVAAIAEHGSDSERLAPCIRAALATLMREPDLLELGIAAARATTSRSRRYLYFRWRAFDPDFRGAEGTHDSAARPRHLGNTVGVSRAAFDTWLCAQATTVACPVSPSCASTDDRVLERGDFAIVDAARGYPQLHGAQLTGRTASPSSTERTSADRHYYQPDAEDLRGQAGTQCP